MPDKPLTEQESLQLITKMINSAKNSFVDTGVGPILWGTVIAICSLVQVAQIQYDFTLPFDIWYLAIFAIVPQIIISMQERKMQKTRGWTDATIGYVWAGFGVGIFIINFINSSCAHAINPILKEYEILSGKKTDLNFWTYGTSYLLFLYGFPTIITAATRKFNLMLYGGILCWLCSIISVFTSISIDFLMMAICAISAWLVPGLILRKRFLNSRKELHV